MNEMYMKIQEIAEKILELADFVAAAKVAADAAAGEYEAAYQAQTQAGKRKAAAEAALYKAQHELIVAAGGVSFYTEFRNLSD